MSILPPAPDYILPVVRALDFLYSGPTYQLRDFGNMNRYLLVRCEHFDRCRKGCLLKRIYMTNLRLYLLGIRHWLLTSSPIFSAKKQKIAKEACFGHSIQREWTFHQGP